LGRKKPITTAVIAAIGGEVDTSRSVSFGEKSPRRMH
jgi:hypothetical protein